MATPAPSECTAAIWNTTDANPGSRADNLAGDGRIPRRDGGFGHHDRGFPRRDRGFPRHDRDFPPHDRDFM
jgi:hypothetical protein